MSTRKVYLFKKSTSRNICFLYNVYQSNSTNTSMLYLNLHNPINMINTQNLAYIYVMCLIKCWNIWYLVLKNCGLLLQPHLVTNLIEIKSVLGIYKNTSSYALPLLAFYFYFFTVLYKVDPYNYRAKTTSITNESEH